MNSLGTLFRITSFGESHGPAVGCIIEGCPAGLPLDINEMKLQLQRRRTGQTDFSSSRKEEDELEWVSGVLDGVSLGSPITLLIRNHNAQGSDYDALKQVYRPGHADYTYDAKYGFRDHKGGGRSSIRVTAPLVAAGVIAKQIVQHYSKVTTTAYVSQIGHATIPATTGIETSSIDHHVTRCPDPETAAFMLNEIERAKQNKDTLGGRITCHIEGMPPGIGEPIFGKLHAQLAHAMFSINTVKGVEFGDGFALAGFSGSESNDVFIMDNGQVKTATNHAGGILGGISNGMPIVFNVAFKPISSIQQKQQTINQEGHTVGIEIGGRHDVCAVPRAVPIVEAYTNIILADLFLLSQFNKRI